MGWRAGAPEMPVLRGVQGRCGGGAAAGVVVGLRLPAVIQLADASFQRGRWFAGGWLRGGGVAVCLFWMQHPVI